MLPYLHDLGVDWVYLSPLLASEPGSTHGYDVVAFDHVDPERGGEEGLAALSAEARRLGMGVLVDIVPNHVGVATPSEDPWWWDVLKLGRESEHASAFDVDWAAGDGRIVIPVIGDDDEGAIARSREGEVRYHDQRFPLAPGTSTLEEQHYELVNWRAADEDLNYRRFFAVNTLAAVRVEDPEVFAETHVEIKRWFDEGLVDGLRVDHPDGLRDPKRYLDDLAALTGGAYVLVEKILEPGEHLPDVVGHRRHHRLRRARAHRPAAHRPGRRGAARPRSRTASAARPSTGSRWSTTTSAPSPTASCTPRSCASPVRSSASWTRGEESADEDAVADAIGELLACFPVYRSYLPEGRDHLDQAFAAARTHRPDLAATYDVLEPLLHDEWSQPARRLQQTSGHGHGQGRRGLLVLPLVAADVAQRGRRRPVDLRDRRRRPGTRRWRAPARLAATRWSTLSTHDTKRGEDVRARITVLAEEPGHWERALDELLRLAPVPDEAFGSLLWQAVLGAWTPDHLPDLRERLHGYAEKAMREAGDRTTWTEPDEAYESQVHAAVDAVFDSDDVRARAGRPRRAHRRARPGQLARGQAARDHDAGRARRLPGQRAVGDLARRPGQPPPRRLRPPGRGARRHRRGRRRDQAARHLLRPDPAARAAGAVHRLHAGHRLRVRRRRTWSPSTAVARSPSPPASPWGWPRPAAGATPPSSCPRAAGTTC